MKLEPLTKEQCQKVRIWRNQISESLRTPYLLTEEMQDRFYEEVVCNRNSPHRYWAIVGEIEISGQKRSCVLVGMGGLINIEWHNRLAEISLIIDPKLRDKGYGEKTVDLLLDQAFNYLNLQTVFGECYLCNPGWEFWGDITDKHNGKILLLPNRKFWKGTYYDSMYFSIDRDDFNKSYICAMCGNQYEKGRPDEEAMREFENIWGQEAKKAALAIVCDDCYQKINPQNHPELVKKVKAEMRCWRRRV